VQFADWLKTSSGTLVDPDPIFDCQIKRIHEYKRQLLNVLRVVVLYNRLREQPGLDMAPRTFFFGGKAAPAYRLAKLIIKLTNNVAATIDADPAVRGRLRIVFLPDYDVTLAERPIPAADLSNQISTAGYESSGTSNMKFMMNGALTRLVWRSSRPPRSAGSATWAGRAVSSACIRSVLRHRSKSCRASLASSPNA
jgi:starch phosphorylase